MTSKNKKRIFRFILTLVIVVGIIPGIGTMKVYANDIFVKTFDDGYKYTIDVELDTDTVGKLRQIMAAKRSVKESQVILVFAGKTLTDDNKTLSDCGIQKEATIHCIISAPTYSVSLTGGGNATASGGETSQADLSGAMATVTYTANTGYHFEEFADIIDNGIIATRIGETEVVVSGTPTADASITIPDAVASSETGGGDNSNRGSTSGGTASTGSDTGGGYVNDITGSVEIMAEGNPFNAKIENSDNLTSLLSLTDAEVAQGVNVWLDIQDMSATVSQTDKDMVQNAIGDYAVGIYLDINLFKKIGNNDATKVTETNGNIKAGILVPESLWKSGRTFEIIRIHNGTADVISGAYDEATHFFVFDTDRFSTYALAYKDADYTYNNNYVTDSSYSDSNNNDSTSSDSSSSIQPKSPNTGDPNDIRIMIILSFLIVFGFMFFETEI